MGGMWIRFLTDIVPMVPGVNRAFRTGATGYLLGDLT
jgi:hypothetical protein